MSLLADARRERHLLRKILLAVGWTDWGHKQPDGEPFLDLHSDVEVTEGDLDWLNRFYDGEAR